MNEEAGVFSEGEVGWSSESSEERSGVVNDDGYAPGAEENEPDGIEEASNDGEHAQGTKSARRPKKPSCFDGDKFSFVAFLLDRGVFGDIRACRRNGLADPPLVLAMASETFSARFGRIGVGGYGAWRGDFLGL